MVMSAETQEAESAEGEKEPLLPTRNLLRIDTYNIRGLFHEKYFWDKSVPALEIKIKKLMPMDAESRRLIDWMEKGVYDALQKKYLKTLLLCICEKEEGPMIEEYAFSFSYPNINTEEVAMNMSRTGSKKCSTTFTSNASEVTPDNMRSSACKMIRTMVSLMRTLDPMPEEQTILMKLLYYDDVISEDYEPPFFKGCADNEAIDIWNNNPLNMEVGNVNSKHLVLALKVKSVLDPCDDNNINSGDDGMSVDNETYQDDDFSNTEVRPFEADCYVVAPNDGKCKGQNAGTISEEDTQDAAHEEELTAQVKEWICSREIGTINVSDVLSNFPDVSKEMVEDIMKRLLKDGVLSRASKYGYTVNQTIDPKTPHIKEVSMQNVSPTEGTKQNNGDLIYMKVRPSETDLDLVAPNGKSIIYSKATKTELLEKDKRLEGNEGGQTDNDTNAKNDKLERLNMKGSVGCILCTNPIAKSHWNLDSGASNHICGRNKWLTNLRPIPKDKENYFLNAAKKKIQLSEMGDIMSQNIRLYNVYLSNDLEENELYVSIGQLTGEGYVVMINKGEVTIRLAKNFNHIVGNGSLDHDTMAYILEFFNGSVLQREDEDQLEENQGGEYVMAEGQWVLDSGCHHHITRKALFLKKKRKLWKKKKLDVAGYGSLTCKFKGDVEKGGLRLKDVYLCQGSRRNLISVSQLDILGYNFLFSGNHCEIRYKDEEDLLGIAHVDAGNLNYYVEFLHSKE